MYLNEKICAECKGKCCKRMPGIYSPSDLGKTKDEMLKNIITGFKAKKFAIDWYEGDPREGQDKLCSVEYVRPAIKGIRKLYDPSWGGGECIFLTDKGCKLAPEKRPYQCRMLEPHKKHCISHDYKDKAEAARDWIPFAQLIKDAAQAVGEIKIKEEG